jgi:integrase/recombinase XerD
MAGELARAVGISYKKVHPHTLRHTFAKDLLKVTKNLRLVQKALGQENIGTTQIYLHIIDDELEEALKNFPEWSVERPGGKRDPAFIQGRKINMFGV